MFSFKNIKSSTETQTVQKPALYRSNTIRKNVNNTKNQILYAILVRDRVRVEELVNNSNVNNIIDDVNDYTALHHAVRIRGNDSIIKYLISIGANPKLKQNENKDAIDLSIEANYRFLIDELLKDINVELDNIYDKFDNIKHDKGVLEIQNKNLTEENTYLKKISTQNTEKISSLKTDNEKLKRKFEDSEKAFQNLLKKNKKN